MAWHTKTEVKSLVHQGLMASLASQRTTQTGLNAIQLAGTVSPYSTGPLSKESWTVVLLNLTD